MGHSRLISGRIVVFAPKDQSLPDWSTVPLDPSPQRW